MREKYSRHLWLLKKMESWRYSMRGFGGKSWGRMRCRGKGRWCLYRSKLTKSGANGTATLPSTSWGWGTGLKRSTTRSNRILMIVYQMQEAMLSIRETRISIKRWADPCGCWERSPRMRSVWATKICSSRSQSSRDRYSRLNLGVRKWIMKKTDWVGVNYGKSQAMMQSQKPLITKCPSTKSVETWKKRIK